MASPQQEFPEAYEICKQFTLTEDQMFEVVERLTKEIEMGLRKETNLRSTVKCYITYVQDVPSGKERGKYLALDLGGSNFRVLLVDLKSEKDVDIQSKSFVLGKNLLTGSGKRLFDYIAECLAEFCIEHRIAWDNLPLGFTFSFPCKQTAINKGVLVNWTKGFKCPDVVGHNVVQMLQQAIDSRLDLRVRVVAILSDTTGTLMACAQRQPNCRIGLIVGNVCNACYIEKTENTEMFQRYQTSRKRNMIVNCEWGSFGDNGVLDFIRTSYDKAMDQLTPDPMTQTFDKCISGVYLGEIVRQIVLDLMRKDVIFKGLMSQAIQTEWKFESRFLTEIESEPLGQYRSTAMVLNNLGIRTCNEKDLACLRYICETVTRRSAQLVACGLVCLIRKMNVCKSSVGIDGGMYRYHPNYHKLLIENMNILLKCSAEYELVLSEDGSGRGAALVAAIYSCK
ncbi:hexokinase type 2-like [Drosophila novamexicana]|uniref:hexokinase type 2-like n=1 Tax=Drosophila novamexicana TaxID=47314 RepID=UPI0011E5C355|nr:hexokinase type 2-like [Drosophila novamexicana]